MIPRLITAAFSARLPASLSFALFSTTASSSNPSQAQFHRMSVKQLVEDAITSNKITIFSKTWCPYSKKAKALLTSEFPDTKTVIYELDEREDGDDIQAYLFQKTGQRTVPNIFVNQKHIGGNDDTQAAFKNGTLTQLVKA
ncbi:thioredoxin-like protein [Gymnopilus junonius]|uniref:glutathione peroxidase n=1 Tax=Gymnopilus junonius TaxID=109634 RepID=A0A9P5NQL3_GYMJU|nr:thioredoxin-like protein [Gymnopilus junonius]